MYDEFSKVYDKFQEIDYDKFVGFYLDIFKKKNMSPELILDLACGTGNITIPMAKLGYNMIGLDISTEMLNIARQKAAETETKYDILFLQQDMTEFELYGTVDVIICALDGINYLSGADELENVFALAHNYLNPDGVMIFDINTEYKLEHILGDNVFVYDDDGAYCVWNCFYDKDERTSSFELNIFIKDEETGLYSRGDEYQEEKAFSIEEISSAAQRSGLSVYGIYDELKFEEPKDDSERVFFVVEKEK